MSGIITQTLTLEQVSTTKEGTAQSGKQWTSNDLIFTGEYDKKLAITAFNLETNADPGRTYIVRYTIESREFNGKWYTNAKLKSMEPVQAPEIPAQPQPQQATIPGGSVRDQAVQRSQQRTAQLAAEQVNDLPF